MVRKILVEGLDYAGKSTLCRNLVSEYTKRGLSAVHNKGNLFKTRFDDFVKAELYSEHSDIVRLNALLTLGPLVDGLSDTNIGSDLIIQESYVDRTIAYNIVNDIPYFHELLTSLDSKLSQFDVSIFLDADINERKKRFEKRVEERNKYDDLIYSKPDDFEKMNAIMRERMSQRQNSHRIDTSYLSEERVFFLAREFIGDFYDY